MNKIRQCRELNHMSQKYVALSVGVSAPMVSQWESGIKKPSMENLVKLASLFGVTTDYLLDHSPARRASADPHLPAAEPDRQESAAGQRRIMSVPTRLKARRICSIGKITYI